MARARRVHRVRCAAAVATRVQQLQRSRRDPQEHYNIYNRLHCVQSDFGCQHVVEILVIIICFYLYIYFILI